MTIKELEEKTGLARANIRYYEQQGLLAPERKENGYRNYSEMDVATLQKIKLLRHLGLSIETIRQVQTGEHPLEEALAEREKALAEEVFVLGKEITICKELQTKRVEYRTLQPEAYLDQLKQAEDTRQTAWEPPHPEDEDQVKPVMHPWRRFFARMLDLALYDLLLPLFLLLLLKLDPGLEGILWLLRNGNLLCSILHLASGAVLMLFLEPLLLTCFGTTPGKALFGLHVFDSDGKRLDYAQAFARTKGVLFRGLALRVPLVDLYCFWKCYSKCSVGRFQLWEEDTVETLRDTKLWRGAAFVGTCALVELCALVIGLQVILPPHHGDLTEAEYIENWNYIAVTMEYPVRLDAQGQWQKSNQTAGIGAFEIQLFDALDMEQTILTDAGGQVTSVQLTAEKQQEGEGNIVDLGGFQTRVMISALALQSEKQGPFGLGYYRVLKQYAKQGSLPLDRSDTLTIADVSMTWETEIEGYRFFEDSVLWPEEEEGSASYRCAVMLAWAD